MALAAMYVSDGTFAVRSTERNDRVQGQEGIAEQWQSILRTGVVSISVTSTRARREGEAIVEEGSFTMRRKDKSLFAQGRYTARWRRDVGVWKLEHHALVAE